jgi:hypothetical protein
MMSLVSLRLGAVLATTVASLSGLLLAGTDTGGTSFGQVSRWPGQYRIDPWDVERLTDADVVGPDGIVYPNVSSAGYEGAIPDVNDTAVRSGYEVIDVTALGARGDDDGFDDAAFDRAVERAIAHVSADPARHKAIIYIPAGTYRLRSGRDINRGNIVVDGDGPDRTCIELHPDPARRDVVTAINFTGGSYSASRKVVGSTPRGGRRVVLDSADVYAPGDRVRIDPQPSSDEVGTMKARYDKPDLNVLYGGNSHFGRMHYAKVTAVEGNAIFVDPPLSHDLYADDRAEVRKCDFVEHNGLQDLLIENVAKESRMNPFGFGRAANGWVQNLYVRKADNWPYSFAETTHMTIRDTRFDGTWADTNSGGNAYLGWCGWAGSTFNLLENVTANDMRHFAIFQWSSNCVVRRCTFNPGGTSAQLHGRFPLENLVEQNVFNLSGSAVWCDPAHTLRHGPNGPRFVLYHNDFRGDGKGNTGSLELLGCNSEHIYAYNRLYLSSPWRPTLLAVDRSFDGILRGNVARVVGHGPLAVFEDPTSDGWDIYDNRVYGSNGYIWQGQARPRRVENNRFHPDSNDLPAPAPETPSIYEWMRAHGNTPRVLVLAMSRTVAESKTATVRVVRVKANLSRDLPVTLASDNPALVIPAGATIPAGRAFVDVEVRAQLVDADVDPVTITAWAEGLMSDIDKLTVLDSASQIDFGKAPDTTSAALGDGWHAMDLGDTGVAGSEARGRTPGSIVLRGAGNNLERHTAFSKAGRRFVFKPADGDVQVIARLDPSAPAAAQHGLLITDDPAAWTEFFLVTQAGDVFTSGYAWNTHGGTFQHAKADKGPPPKWLRVTRVGTVFTAYRADTDAAPKAESDWKQIVSVDFYYDSTPGRAEWDYKSQSTLDTRVYAGLFLSSGKAGELAQVEFADVDVSDRVPPIVARPTFSSPSGKYPTRVALTIDCPTPGATVRYTTDGTDPSRDAGEVYRPGQLIEITTKTGVRAMAFKDGHTDSRRTSAEYILVCATPTITLAGGSTPAGLQTVTIACDTPGAEIRYTLDGSRPDNKSPLYAGPITIKGRIRVTAVAFKQGLDRSEFAVADFK